MKTQQIRDFKINFNMINFSKIALSFLLMLLFSISLNQSIPAKAADAQPNTKISAALQQAMEDTRPYTFRSEKGRTYCYDVYKNKIKSSFIYKDKAFYYFNNKGIQYRGWYKLHGDYFYFHRKTGKMQENGKVDGIVIKDRQVKLTKWAKKKIKTMITARKIVAKITKPKDSKMTKFNKCFHWVMKFPYITQRKFKTVYKQKGWEMTYANHVFRYGGGDCTSDACAIAFLAKECGLTNVYIAHDTGHTWMEWKGKAWDTLFAESKSFKKYYGCPLKKYCCWRAGKRKV